MVFLTQNDFNIKLSQDVLNQILQNDTTVLDNAEQQAIAQLTDYISGLHNIEVELAKTGTDRHDTLIRWLMNLTVYFIYERIPDEQVPARVVKNYDDTRSDLEKIARGKMHTTLEPLLNDDETKKTIFRWGSNPPRSHNPL